MSKWAFSCAKKWHTPNEDFPKEQMVFNGNVYNGYICLDCGCAYFQMMGKASPILGPEGLVQP